MSITALVLYGSIARGDNEKDSDIDMFAISTEQSYRMIVKNKINIAKYPYGLAQERAMRGDLFILHIITEGKIIYDSEGNFSTITSHFQYKDSYKNEIISATEIGLALFSLSSTIDNYYFLNKTMAWCVRTILIAKSADNRNPLFSARDLAEFSNAKSVYELIKNKDSNILDKSLSHKFLTFIHDFGDKETIKTYVSKSTLDDYKAVFQLHGNKYGLKLLKSIRASSGIGRYY
jgi:Polymerase beta, Nucleotidyltransferase